MGKGGAQLGKSVKGKSKERRVGVRARAADAAVSAAVSADFAALQQYEEAQQQAEQQRRRMKELLSSEASAASLASQQLSAAALAALRSEKLSGLRAEIAALEQSFSFDLARKQIVLQKLLDELQGAEEQFAFAQRAHLGDLDSFHALHRQRLAAVEEEFEREAHSIKREFVREREAMLDKYKRLTSEFQFILTSIEADELERQSERRTRHETEREEIRNKNLESINELRINLENKIEELERAFDDCHRIYIEATDVNNEHFKRLKAEDAQLSLLIFEKKKKILRWQQCIHNWRKKTEINDKEGRERNARLCAQKDAIGRNCRELKAKMLRFRAAQQKKMSDMALMARDALKCSQNKLALAEKILLLAELARKFETEREKILPFEFARIGDDAADAENALAKAGGVMNAIYSSTQSSAGDEHKEAALSSSPASLSSSPAPAPAPMNAAGDALLVGDYNELQRFYSRYNKVLLDKLAIDGERRRLQQENADLKELVQRYLDGVGIAPHTLSTQDNPLLIVNGRLNLTEPANVVMQQSGSSGSAASMATMQHTLARRGRPNVTQEALQITQNYQLQATGTRARLRG